MNLKSPLFDRVRIKRPSKEPPRDDAPRCQHPGCSEAGEFRAPMGRLREGEYFCFCLEHVRQYNAAYNYFSGMSAEAVAQFQRDAIIGHRPTWAIGGNSKTGAFYGKWSFSSWQADHLRDFEPADSRAGDMQHKPRDGAAALKALNQLGLDEGVDMTVIKARYKDLVKRLHPDANAGDRSNEERLREIIRAYNYLRSIRRP